MAYGGKPNSEFCMDSLLAELKTISVANGRWSDVRTVVMPDYAPESDVMFQAETPSLHVWVMGSGGQEGLISRARRSLEVWIYGVVKQDRGAQTAILRLAEDVRSVMIMNPERDYPGLSVANTWGHFTEEQAGGFSFLVDRNEQGKSIGEFRSEWKVVYNYDNPNG